MHASRALRVPVQAVVFAKIVFVVTQTRPDRHSTQLKMHNKSLEHQFTNLYNAIEIYAFTFSHYVSV